MTFTWCTVHRLTSNEPWLWQKNLQRPQSYFLFKILTSSCCFVISSYLAFFPPKNTMHFHQNWKFSLRLSINDNRLFLSILKHIPDLGRWCYHLTQWHGLMISVMGPGPGIGRNLEKLRERRGEEGERGLRESCKSWWLFSWLSHVTLTDTYWEFLWFIAI